MKTMEETLKALEKSAKDRGGMFIRTAPPCVPFERWERFWLKLDIRQPEINDAALSAFSYAKNYLKRWPVKQWGGLIVLCGPPGAGKSHIGAGLFNACVSTRDLRDSAERCDWPARVDRFTADRGGEVGGKFFDLLQTHLLFVDDVGSESDPFKLGASKLKQLIDRRDAKAWTIITTNFPQSAWREKFDERLADRLAAGTVVDFTGVPSYRTK